MEKKSGALLKGQEARNSPCDTAAEKTFATAEDDSTVDAILNYIPLGISIIDENCSVVYNNEKYKAMLPCECPIEKSWAERLGENQGGAACIKGAPGARGKTATTDDSRLVDGRTFRITSTEITYKEKRALLRTFEDITERKCLEAELEKYAKSIEPEVKRRTSELIQTEKMASLDMLVAGVSHEINNPMSYLKANTEYALEDIASLKKKNANAGNQMDADILENSENMLASNLRGIERIVKITKTLKRFTKPDAAENAPADINQGIKDTLVMLNDQFKYKSEVHAEYGPLPSVRCSIGQLNQVFMNLLINAAQAMEHGDIWIKTYRDDKNAYVDVKDNGCGIPEEKKSMVFDPFYTTKKEGIGLGLSISYKIVQEHKGSISFESKTGEGTTFTVRIPIDVRVSEERLSCAPAI